MEAKASMIKLHHERALQCHPRDALAIQPLCNGRREGLYRGGEGAGAAPITNVDGPHPHASVARRRTCAPRRVAIAARSVYPVPSTRRDDSLLTNHKVVTWWFMDDVEPTLNPGFEGVVTTETNAVFLVGHWWIRESDCRVGRANIVSPLRLNRIMHGK
jgi:hypothetical protein